MNISLFYFLYSIAHQYSWLDSIIWFFAVPFIYIMMIVIAFVLFRQYKIFSIPNTSRLLKGKARDIALVFFSGGLAYVISSVLKIIIHTDRPMIALADVHSLFFESGYAFPSGHSATIAALAVGVFFHHKRLGYVCMIAGLLFGLARVVAGVHFPIDIIGGYALGFLVAFFVKSL